MGRRRFLIIAGYVAFGLVLFLLFLYLTFPVDAVGQRLSHELSSRTGGKFTTTFSDISLYRLTGVALQDVKVRAATQPGVQPIEVALDALRVRVQILPLFALSLAVDASVEVAGGSAQAAVAPQGESGVDVDVELDNMDLGAAGLLEGLTGFPIGGRASGTVNAAWRKDPRASNGAVSLKIVEVQLGPGQVQGFTLPSTALGELELELVMKEGALTVKRFEQTGGDFQVEPKGSIRLESRWLASTVDACVKFRADDGYLAKNPKMKTALQLAAVRIKKDAEGFFNIPLRGPVSNRKLVRPGLCKGGRGK